MGISAVLFDMVGVLLFKKGGYAPRTEEQLNAEEIEKLYNHIDDKRLIKDIKEKLRLTGSEVDKALEAIPQKYEKYQELWNLLPKLNRKYKLAVINNGNSLANKYWFKRFDFDIFDLFISSGVEGVKKPHPQIYRLAYKRLKVEPESCLFMDDSFENIQGAQELGMKTIWWDRRKERACFYKKLLNLVGEDWISPSAEIRPSSIEGKGLYATKPIKKGDLVVIWGGTYTDFKGAEKAKQNGKVVMQWDEDLFSVEDRGETSGYFINHSCEPNLWMKGAYALVAMRNVKKGEELTADYVIWEADEDYVSKWDCNCGSTKCRRRITGKDWRLPELQERYKGRFSPLINKRIE